MDFFIEEHLRTGKGDKDTIDPPSETDVKNSHGNHNLHGYFKAQIYNDGDTVADISVKFIIEDYYDFDNRKRLEVHRYGIGVVPHRWLNNPQGSQWAAEFDYYTLWNEHLIVDETYKVREVPDYGVPGWPAKPPTPDTEDAGGAVRVKCQGCKAGRP